MANNSLLAPLEAVLSQSQSLLSLAHEQNWAAFEVLLQQRQAGMRTLTDGDYLNALAAANLDVKAKELVSQIQTLNDQLGELAVRQREKLVAEVRQLSISDKAINAYGQ